MVERFELDFHGPYGEDAYMAKEEDGGLVLYSDYAALEAENARLRAEVERLEDRLNSGGSLTAADFRKVENKVILILEDIEPWALDDTGLHIPDTEIKKAAEKIMCILTEILGEQPAVAVEKCDGQACYYHGCQHLPGCSLEGDTNVRT